MICVSSFKLYSDILQFSLGGFILGGGFMIGEGIKICTTSFKFF